MNRTAPKCWKRQCKHWIDLVEMGGEEDDRIWPVCRAFPEGIPEEIAYGDDEHLNPFSGDNGIQYEAASDEEWEKIQQNADTRNSDEPD